MKIFNDCLPCLMRQALEASRMASDNETLQQEIQKECATLISHFTNFENSPDLAYSIHEIVKKHTKNLDPYSDIKKRDIENALALYPYLKKVLKESNNSLYLALKISAIGNIMDSAIFQDLNVKACLEDQLKMDFTICDIELFTKDLELTKTILFLGDNAGETVFDRVLIESLPKGIKIIYAVRQNPIINDAVISDAIDSGLNESTTIIPSGCSAPGTILSKCSKEFLKVFNSADIVISKGQGNYEALADYNRKIYFLLKAKCNMIAQRFDVPVMSYIFKLDK